ncbi:MAG: hypothetical protein HC837_04330 [Chloroflexaceae bacterium]|nr:hypothetical protein [Chloroflexaceae bacterium]
MAVTSRDMHTTPAWSRSRSPRVRGPMMRPRSIRPFIWFILVIQVAIVIYLLVSQAIGLGQSWIDDLRYGNPRTAHIAGFVGHNEAHNQPSHFFALNLDRQVVVLEFPGGDASNVRTLVGPYLFGADADRHPVMLDLRDVDGDQNVDLLLTVRDEQIAYVNKEGTFRLPTGEEWSTIQQLQP